MKGAANAAAAVLGLLSLVALVVALSTHHWGYRTGSMWGYSYVTEFGLWETCYGSGSTIDAVDEFDCYDTYGDAQSVAQVLVSYLDNTVTFALPVVLVPFAGPAGLLRFVPFLVSVLNVAIWIAITIIWADLSNYSMSMPWHNFANDAAFMALAAFGVLLVSINHAQYRKLAIFLQFVTAVFASVSTFVWVDGADASVHYQYSFVCSAAGILLSGMAAVCLAVAARSEQSEQASSEEPMLSEQPRELHVPGEAKAEEEAFIEYRPLLSGLDRAAVTATAMTSLIIGVAVCTPYWGKFITTYYELSYGMYQICVKDGSCEQRLPDEILAAIVLGHISVSLTFLLVILVLYMPVRTQSSRTVPFVLAALSVCCWGTSYGLSEPSSDWNWIEFGTFTALFSFYALLNVCWGIEVVRARAHASFMLFLTVASGGASIGVWIDTVETHWSGLEFSYDWSFYLFITGLVVGCLSFLMVGASYTRGRRSLTESQRSFAPATDAMDDAHYTHD